MRKTVGAKLALFPSHQTDRMHASRESRRYSRRTAVIWLVGHRDYQQISGDMSSIAADINATQNPESTIDRPSRRFHHCLHFRPVRKGSIPWNIGCALTSRWLFPKLYWLSLFTLLLFYRSLFLSSFFSLSLSLFLSLSFMISLFELHFSSRSAQYSRTRWQCK